MGVVQAYGVLLGLLALLVVMFSPFAIIAINAVKTPTDLAANGPLSLPQNPTMDNIVSFWNAVDFGGALTEQPCDKSLRCGIRDGPIAAERIRARYRTCARRYLDARVLHAREHPAQRGHRLSAVLHGQVCGLYNTQLAVIIVFTVIQSAFGTYFIASIMRAFPREILDAARVDGCGKIQLLVRVVVPIMGPSLAVLMVFAFIWTWNEFYLPLVFLVDNSQYTVPLAVAATQGEHMMNESQVAASALLGVLPCVLFFLVFQRTLTRGITAGSYR
jgi:raffinose/stachyose/melibiose transport system permease protein